MVGEGRGGEEGVRIVIINESMVAIITHRTGTHYMFRPTHLRNYNMNFGHLFVDDILSAYIAMQVTPLI